MTPQQQRLTVPALHRDGDVPPSAMDEGWVFVFGSNLAGRHGAGAALVAAERDGAQNGVGEGAFASSYAVPGVATENGFQSTLSRRPLS